MTAVLFGCSSSLFTGEKGNELDQAKGDGNFNPACVGLDLSQATLDVQTTRSLVTCLNSNGSIQEFQDLVKSLNDGQLQIVLDTLNSELMLKADRLKAVDASFQQMDERGVLTRAFDKLSKVLANGKLIRSTVRLLKQTSTAEGNGILPEARRTKLNPDVLNSIKAMTQELARDASGQYSTLEARKTLANGLEMGVRTTALKSYKGMVDGLHSYIPLRNSGLNLRFFTERGLEYIKAKIHSDRAYGKVLLWGIEDGSLLDAFDYYYYSECEKVTPGKCNDGTINVDAQTQAMEAFLRLLTLEKKDEILAPMVKLFRVMDAPISCMAETKIIPNADLFVMNELIKLVPLDVPQWTMRTNMLKMKVANSMCSFPSAPDATFNDLMTVLRELARYTDQSSFGRPLITTSHFLKGLEVGDSKTIGAGANADLKRYMSDYPANERYRRFMMHWIGDKDEQVNAYTHLADLLGELSRPERQVVGNLLYLLNVPAPGSKDRLDLRAAVRALVKSQGLLGGRSVYDVFSDAVLKVDVGTLYDLFSGMSELIDSPDDLANPLLDVTRDAVLLNDASPLIEIALDLGLNADKHEVFFQTLFDIADTKEFEGAMKLTARMAGNGTLRELLKGILMMFRGHTEGLPAPHPQDVPPAKLADAGRDKSTRDRPAWNPMPPYWPQDYERVDACYAVNLDLKIGQPFPGSDSGRAAWESQMDKIAGCVNANGQNRELEDFLNYGIRQRLENGKPVLAALTEQLADFIPGGGDRQRLKEVYDELGDLLLDDGNYRDMKAMNEMLPLLFNKQYCTAKHEDGMSSNSCPRGNTPISIMQALARALSVISGEKGKIQDLLNVGQVAVQDRGMPKTVAFLYDASNEAEDMKNDPVGHPFVPDEKPPIVSYPINNYPKNRFLEAKIKQYIKDYEGREPTDEILREKTNAFFNQPLPAEQKFYADYKGRTRMGYKDAEDFKASLKGLLDELSKGNRIESTMTFFYRMDRDPYTPEWWAGWFRRLAANVAPIPYYYPGQYPVENKPTVRMISQLEMLDLVVANADFTLKEVGQPGLFIVKEDDNFGIKYLTLLGLAGDNITSVVDRMEREINEFYSLHDRTKGLPRFLRNAAMKPEVRRRICNLKVIFPILKQVNRFTEFEMPDHSIVRANDLGVLRDLFKAVLKDMPEKDQDEWDNKELYHRDKNPLALVAEMVRFGILRNVSSNMWYVNKDVNNLARPHHEDDTDKENRLIIPQHASPVFRFLTDSAIVRHPTHRSLNQDALAVLRYLVREDCDKTSKPEWANLPCVPADPKKDPRPFNARYRTVGKLIDEFFKWIADDDRREDQKQPRIMSYVKRSGYHVVELIQALGGTERAEQRQFTRDVAKLLKPLLGSAKGAELIAENADLLEPLMKDVKSVHLLKILLDAQNSDRQRPDTNYTDGQAFTEMRSLVRTAVTKLDENDAKAASSAVDLLHMLYKDPSSRFRAFTNSLDWLKVDPEYTQLKRDVMDRVTGQVIHWLPKEPTANQSRSLRPRSQEYLGAHLGNGDLRDLLTFIGAHSTGTSDEFYNQIKFVGDRSYVDKINDFTDLLRSGIVDVYPPKPLQANR